MAEIVGIRFKRAGKVYYFDPGTTELEPNDNVVVETSRGPEVGWVVIAPKQVVDNEISEPLKPVLRIADSGDLKRLEEMRQRSQEALSVCTEKVEQLNLPMKLVDAEYNLDASRLTVYFGAEGRVDFRELVRELAATFHTRVELRQIGPRDEAKQVGGYGRCGRPLCCANHLCEFSAVSIKMAKDQDLPLNPTKISGLCGRLLCCLSHEAEQYKQMKEMIPKAGQKVDSPQGPGTVIGSNILRETVSLRLDTDARVEIPVSQLNQQETEPPKRRRRRSRRRRRPNSGQQK
jgi:cell fate regulator YaaT (PSP1 superfamily)